VEPRQYATFIEEPLYWHTFVRTAAMSIIATAATLLIAFPVAWYIAKIARGPREVDAVRPVPHSVLGERDGAHAGLDDPAARVRRAAASAGGSRITAAPVELLYHDATILVGLVYTSMLFMVVPLVSALESLDDSLIEAAYDLGGSGASILREIVIRTRRQASPPARSSCSC
jgi:spermidine/putrescine transport system permease protein